MQLYILYVQCISIKKTIFLFMFHIAVFLKYLELCNKNNRPDYIQHVTNKTFDRLLCILGKYVLNIINYS